MTDAEEAVRLFLAACQKEHYAIAGEFVQITERDRVAADLPDRIRAALTILAASDRFALDSFKVGDMVEYELPDYDIVSNDVMVDVPYQVEFETPDGPTEVVGFARTICESSPYKTDPAGTWGVNTISLLRQRRRSRIER